MLRGLFAGRKIAGPVSEIAVCLLQMKHDRIVNAGVNVLLCESAFCIRFPVLDLH